MQRLMLAAAVSVAAAGVCAAPARATSPQYDRCMDRSEGITSNMRDCAQAEGVRQDRELNAVYKQAMAKLDPAGKIRLRNQERAWLKTSRAFCDAEYNKEEGTEALLVLDSCLLDADDKRIGQLKAIANKPPGTSVRR